MPKKMEEIKGVDVYFARLRKQARRDLRQQAINTKRQIRACKGSRSLAQVAVEVHSTTIGTYDRSRIDQEKDLALLRGVLVCWDKTECSFDGLVKALITEAIAEANKWSM